MASIDTIISNAQGLAGSAQAAAVALFYAAQEAAQTSAVPTTGKTVDDVADSDALTYDAAPEFAGTLSAPSTAGLDLAATLASAATGQQTTMRAFIDGGMASFITAFVPDYSAVRDELTAKISAGLTGGIAISDGQEQAIYTRARDRIEAESAAAQTQAEDTWARRGFPLPAGVMTATLRQVQKDTADRAARAATETAVQRIQFETQFAQACLAASQALTGGTLQGLLSYAGIVATLNEATLQYATATVAAIEATTKLKLAVAQANYDADSKAFEHAMTTLAADVENLAKKVGLQLERARLLLDKAKVQVQADLEVDRMKVQHEINKVNAVVSAANSGASPQAHIASSAISSINTTVSEHTEN